MLFYSAISIALTWFQTSSLPLLVLFLHVSSHCIVLSVALRRCSLGMAARNLINRKITSQARNSTLITSRFVRLLLLCVVVGVWPLLATLLSIFHHPWPDRVTSWPGWVAVHRHFYDIPAIPFHFLTADDRQKFLRSFSYQIISGFLVFGIFVFTEDVREDLGRFWKLLTHKIPRPSLCKPVPPSLLMHEASGSHAFTLTTSVIDISPVKMHSGETLSACEPMPSTTNTVS